MRYERFCFYTIFLMALACSRETPVPSETTTTTATPPPSTTVATTAPSPATGGSYDEAMLWFRSAPAFHFVVEEGGIHAEGDLTRKTIGLESIRFRANGEEWRAASGPRGVSWERGGKVAAAPAYGNRLYQRVTLAFDPQKKEGTAQLAEPGHYRFTNANTGEVHDVWVTPDNQISRMTIENAFELTLEKR